MFLAGVQEDADSGLWVCIMEMNRRSVVKKYGLQKLYGVLNQGDSRFRLHTVSQIYRNPEYRTIKKQFSQIGRPPKFKQVMPRILFRPSGGRFCKDHKTSLFPGHADIPLVLVGESGPDSFEIIAETALKELVVQVIAEERIKGVNGLANENTSALLSVGLALWGGEKMWRMVRYGG
ncbi:hypothetical protein OOT00_07050 [Desulfobotulus sp. H1]|uniref:Uncharacterized protein n=1 Tax=Desulfobotulus pelophilus TaxID=2823377 RepID=A0ABT3N8F8_9BACT|nr:hypothetical protein [Desulfobotulus pelophilus]MCW7753739.1 hypothetical protein [Desulfobotulus pelophilus]